MATVNLRVRYQRLSLDHGVEYTQSSFHRPLVEWQRQPEGPQKMMDWWPLPTISYRKRPVEIWTEATHPVAHNRHRGPPSPSSTLVQPQVDE